MRRLLAGAATAALAAVLAPGAASAAAGDVYVGPCREGGFATIQAGVDAAPDGGTVWVCPGTFTENVVVGNRSGLTLRSLVVPNEPVATVDGGGSTGRPAVSVVDSTRVTVRGLRIVNAAVGVLVGDSPRTQVVSNRIDAVGRGIAIAGASNRSRATGNVLTGANPDDGDDGDTGDTGRRAIRTERGVDVDSAARVRLEENRVTGFELGYVLVRTPKAVLVHNGSSGAASVGIVLDTVTDARVRDSRVKGAEVGLLVTGESTRNLVTGTRSRSNDFAGIFVQTDPVANTFDTNLAQYNGAVDVIDDTGAPPMRRPSGTAGTDNTWKRLRCDTSSPATLCGRPATERLPAFRWDRS